MSNLGVTFKKAREAAGIPLEEIAAETRISTRFLVAIENETFQLLPGGIFNRGFIRAYAEYLGINAEQAVADYDRMSATTTEPIEVLRDAERETRSSDRYLYPIAAAILVILVVAYYLVTRKPAAPPEQVPPSAAQPAPEPVPEATIAATTTPPDVAPKLEDTPPASPLAGIPSAPSPAPAQVSSPSPATTQPANRTATSPASSAAALTLDVEAKEETWIQVLADGTNLFADVLQPGATRHFSGDRLIDITIGNAAGASLKINGRDPGRLGTSGQVRQLKITPENATQIH